MSTTRINCIRIDFIPNIKIPDLSLGACRKYLQTNVQGFIHGRYMTIRYTQNLTLQVFIKKRIRYVLTCLANIINNIRKIFNKFKATEVSHFAKVVVRNIHGSGHLPIEIRKFNTGILSDDFSAAVGCYGEPAVGFRGLVPRISFSSLIISHRSGALVRLNFKGNFTLISKSVESFCCIKDFLNVLKRCCS